MANRWLLVFARPPRCCFGIRAGWARRRCPSFSWCFVRHSPIYKTCSRKEKMLAMRIPMFCMLFRRYRRQIQLFVYEFYFKISLRGMMHMVLPSDSSYLTNSGNPPSKLLILRLVTSLTHTMSQTHLLKLLSPLPPHSSAPWSLEIVMMSQVPESLLK